MGLHLGLVDSRLYADPNCPICEGKGRVPKEPGSLQRQICICVELNLRRALAERLLEHTLPPAALKMTLATFNTGGLAPNELALRVARNFVDHYLQAAEEGWALGFWGKPRTGKTHLAVATALACTKRYLIRPYLLNLPRALAAERERFRDDAVDSPFKKAAACDLLILDDLGAEYQRQGADSGAVSWVSEMVYNLVDERIMNTRPILYTSNLSPQDMQSRYGGETWARVLGRLREAEVNPAGALEVIEVPGEGVARNSDAAGLLFGGEGSARRSGAANKAPISS